MTNVFMRTAVWCNVFHPERLTKYASWNGGNISDVFLPTSESREHFDAIRATPRPVGSPFYNEGVTKLRCHAAEQAGDRTPQELADSTHEDIARLALGAVEWDIEVCFRVGDDAQRVYIEQALAAFRKENPTFLVRINIPPFKGYTIPRVVFSDTNVYVAEQTYYGEMDPVDHLDAWFDLPLYLRNSNRAGLCIGAATERRTDGKYDPNGRRERALDSLLYKGNYTGQRVRGQYDIFTDDLMAEVGYL